MVSVTSEITVLDGVSVTYTNCGHCGAFPTSSEIDAALKTMDRCDYTCTICSGKIKWVKAEIHHDPRQKAPLHEWFASGSLEPYVDMKSLVNCNIEGGPQQVGFKAHLSCLLRVIPNIQKS